MKTAKLFMNGRSQAVRLPREFRFEGEQVYVKKIGDSVILIPYHAPWNTLIKSLEFFSEDFMMEERKQPPLENREDAFS